jgi:hypothetical protein
MSVQLENVRMVESGGFDAQLSEDESHGQE